MGTMNEDLWYLGCDKLKLIGYSNSNYGTKLDMKSTSKGCQFLGSSLVSWSSRNNIV